MKRNNKKILAFFSSPCGLNGAAHNFLFVVNTLKANNYDVYCVVAKKDVVYERLLELGARCIYFPIPLGMNTTTILESSDFPIIYRIKQNLKDIIRFFSGSFIYIWEAIKVRPNYIYLMDITFPQIIIANVFFKKNIISEVQGQLINGKIGLRKKILIWLFRRSEKMFGITEKHIHPFKDSKQDNKYQVIYNSYEINKENEANSNNCSVNKIIDDGRKTIIYLGGMNPNKGSLFLIKVIESLKENKNIKWLILGSYNHNYKNKFSAGDSKDYFYETKVWFNFIEQNNLNERVFMLGSRSSIGYFLSQSDILLVPHKFPHFSRPIIEAFALKTPVIATRDKFNSELIEDGVNGFLSDYDNLEEWKQKINSVIDNKKLRETFVKKSYEIYEEKFHPNKISKQIVELFDN